MLFCGVHGGRIEGFFVPKMTYSEKLKDPRWQRKRLEIMEQSEFTCEHCSSTSKTLNVHHVNYDKGKAPWDYDDEHFVTLCEDCHKTLELRIRSLRYALAHGSNKGKDIVLLTMALLQQPPFDPYSGVATEEFVKALRSASDAISDFKQGGKTESQFSTDLALASASRAIWCLKEYIDNEVELISRQNARGAA